MRPSSRPFPPPWLLALVLCFAVSCGDSANPKPEVQTSAGLGAVARYTAPVHPTTREFDEATEAWRWLLAKGAEPLLVTALGDVFCRTADGRVEFLDTESGALGTVASSTAEWEGLLERQENVEHWFRPRFVEQLEQQHSRLAPLYVFSPTIPVVLSGKLTVENYTPSRWDAHLHVLGQIHRQAKDLPPGTPITDIHVEPWSKGDQ